MTEQDDPRSDAKYRAVRLAVIILTTLFLAGIVALAFGFMRQYRLMQAGRARPVAGAAAGVTLAPGARILSAATDSGKLVLQVETPAGREIDIIDLQSGRLTGQVKETPRP